MKKNFLYNLLLTVSNLVFPLLTFPYLSRTFGADGLGICNFIISYGQNYTIIAALGLPVYGMREISKVGDDKAKRSKLFLELLTIHLLFTLVILVIYFGSILLYSEFRNYKNIALLGGSLILFNVFSIEWLFSGINNFKYITIRTVIIRALSVIAILVLVKGKHDFFTYFLIISITTLLSIIIDIYYSRNFISRRTSITFKGIFSHVKPISILGIYMVLTNIYSVLPTTLLGFLSTKSAVGYYYGANKIIRMVISSFTALIVVMLPKLNFAAEKNNKEEYIMLMNKSLNVVISFGIPITFFIYLLADPVIILLAGKSFTNSISVIKIMAPVILIVAFSQVFVFLVLSVNRKDKEMVILSIIGMTISIIINLTFIPNLAEIATGYSQLFSEFTVSIFAFLIARKILDFEFPTRLFILNIICVIPFSIIAYCFKQISNNSLLTLLYSGSACLIYFILYQLFFIKDKLIIGISGTMNLKLKKFCNK